MSLVKESSAESSINSNKKKIPWTPVDKFSDIERITFNRRWEREKKKDGNDSYAVTIFFRKYEKKRGKRSVRHWKTVYQHDVEFHRVNDVLDGTQILKKTSKI